MSRFHIPVKAVAGSLVALVLLLAACEQPRSHGDLDAVIVGVEQELWQSVEEEFRAQMEPTIQTVREERPFRVTQIDPATEDAWGQLRRFRQTVVMGTTETPWVAEALDRGGEAVPEAPALVEVLNVWARGQKVWVLVLPETDPGPAVTELAAEVQRKMDQEYREWVRSRMYVSGRDTILADSLAQNVGFSMQFPNVYRYYVEADSVFRFRNDNPSPRELIREVAVTWWEPAPDELPTRAELEAWRLEMAANYYVDPQELDTSVVTFEPISLNGAEGVEFQSAWRSLPDAWPAGGPFITRAVHCPDQDRLYVMDAWVYAPERTKYQYVIQLQNILNSFRCT